MSTSLHEIDKLFRDGIDGRSEYPPQNVWDNIESELDKETVINSYRRKYNSLKRKTSILFALFLAVIVYGIIKLNDAGNPVGPRHDAAAQSEMGNADNSAKARDMQKPVQQTNIVLEKRKNMKTGQLPV
ncbi:MAG TPA: hypothetical protein VI461_16395, partial [Chitinophagaceae bacterium]|nr:hypothetical protein [Chitinophagaceae bacterium]